MTWDPRVRVWGWARGQNLVHLKNVVFNPSLDNNLSKGIHTCIIVALFKVSFHFLNSNPRVRLFAIICNLDYNAWFRTFAKR